MQKRDLFIGSILSVTAFTAATTHAATVAYWNFEEGTNGANVAHSTGDGVYDGTVPDVSGNGNNLSAFTNGGYAGYQYTNVTPYSATPQTGTTNKLAVINTGGYPALNSSPTGTSVSGGLDLRTIQPTAWTIEASYKPENNNGYRNIVGRDGQNIGGTSANSALYFQLTPDNRFQVIYTDVTGVVHQAASAAGLITNGYTYPNNTDGVFSNFAAVSDGVNLTLYVNGTQVAQTLLTGTSTDLALSNGSQGAASGNEWTAGEFTVGRGLYNGNHGDRAYGIIDDVRISNSALSPTQFLSSTAAVPEPASLGMIGLVAAGLIGKRRRS